MRSSQNVRNVPFLNAKKNLFRNPLFPISQINARLLEGQNELRSKTTRQNDPKGFYIFQLR